MHSNINKVVIHTQLMICWQAGTSSSLLKLRYVILGYTTVQTGLADRASKADIIVPPAIHKN